MASDGKMDALKTASHKSAHAASGGGYPSGRRFRTARSGRQTRTARGMAACDRDQNYDTKNDAPVAGATLYPTEQCSSCSVSLMGLYNDWTKLNTKIDAMTP